jgi:hypothetical protein
VEARIQACRGSKGRQVPRTGSEWTGNTYRYR